MSGGRIIGSYIILATHPRKDTYKAVRIALIEEGEERDYSELVEELLAKWLKSRR